MATATQGRSARVRSLDGLRGVAALVVVLGHVLPSVQAFSGPIHGRYHATGWGWWVTNTPLAALWDGSSAVFLFFVLSGFVLVVGRRRELTQWLSYYPSRLLRLYLPVAGSLAMALVLTAVHQYAAVTPRSLLRDIVLVRGVDLLNSPLWSLQWEVIFSLLLPAYVIFARTGPGWWPLKVLALLGAAAVGFHTAHVSLICLPIFAIGAVLAIEYERGTFESWARQVGPVRARRLITVVAVAAVLTYTSRALIAAHAEPDHRSLVATGVLTIGGAALVVWTTLNCRPVRVLLEGPVARWLGTRSFSLYLIHWPVLATVLYVVDDAGGGTVALVALPLALLAAEAFYRAVERPSHLLARWIGAEVQRRTRQADRAVARR